MNGNEPKSIGELQLYKVLQRANLLTYYDTFISQGGDDVQQLCEAGEEEFLEIMSLVGMASKPLHVRRFQKALQEWVTSPQLFRKSTESPSSTTRITSPADKNIQSNSHKLLLSQFYQRPQSLPSVQHKDRFISDVEKHFKTSPNKTSREEVEDDMETLNQSLDDKTVQLLSKFASKVVDEIYPARPSYDKAMETIKTNKNHAHLIRVVEMKNVEAKNKEIRRLSALFPVQLAGVFSSSPLSMFETMCNEASYQLCQIHPLLLISADRKHRLDAAQIVVRRVEKEIQQSQRGLLDQSVNETFRIKLDEILAKLEEIQVKKEAFNQKIVSAEASKNYVHLLEYRSDLARLRHEEQALLQQKRKILAQRGSLTGDSIRQTVKANGNIPNSAIDLDPEDDISNFTSQNDLKIMTYSSLSDIARAHNVFESSHEEIAYTDDFSGKPPNMDAKQELIDDGLSNLPVVHNSHKRTNDDSDEALPLVKKSKPPT